MIVAFTGPSSLIAAQELKVVASMEAIAAPLNTWRSGCAYGVDTIAAHQAILSDILVVELYVPAAPHNADLVEELAPRAKIINCPSVHDRAECYRIRNSMMVTGADLLVAFVKSLDFYRSGEWMTINLARKLGVTVNLNLI